jgi:hypothetical protein
MVHLRKSVSPAVKNLSSYAMSSSRIATKPVVARVARRSIQHVQPTVSIAHDAARLFFFDARQSTT